MTLYKYGRYLGEQTIRLYQPPFSTSKWNRLCLPNAQTNNDWRQTNSLTYGNPWLAQSGINKLAGKIGVTLNNSGTSSGFHALNSYVSLQGQIDPHWNCNWSLDKVNKKFSFEFYLDSDYAGEQWVLAEIYIPDTVTNIKVYYNYYSDGAWQGYTQFVDYATSVCNQAETVAGNLKNTVIYTTGIRADVKASLATSGGAPPANITYSNNYGCKHRFGLAVKLPADDGLDTATTGDSQCRLKIEVYYDDDGKATYEFSNNTNQYTGLQNINKQYIVLFKSDAVGVVDFFQLNTGLALNSLNVTADHNNTITQVIGTYSGVDSTKKVFWGQSDEDPSTVDGSGIPVVINNIEALVDGGGYS